MLSHLLADDKRPPERDRNKGLLDEQMTELLQKSGIDYGRCHSWLCLQKQSQVQNEAAIPRREVHNIVEALLQNIIEKFDDRMMDIAEGTVIDAYFGWGVWNQSATRVRNGAFCFQSCNDGQDYRSTGDRPCCAGFKCAISIGGGEVGCRHVGERISCDGPFLTSYIWSWIFDWRREERAWEVGIKKEASASLNVLRIIKYRYLFVERLPSGIERCR